MWGGESQVGAGSARNKQRGGAGALKPERERRPGPPAQGAGGRARSRPVESRGPGARADGNAREQAEGQRLLGSPRTCPAWPQRPHTPRACRHPPATSREEVPGRRGRVQSVVAVPPQGPSSWEEQTAQAAVRGPWWRDCGAAGVRGDRAASPCGFLGCRTCRRRVPWELPPDRLRHSEAPGPSPRQAGRPLPGTGPALAVRGEGRRPSPQEGSRAQGLPPTGGATEPRWEGESSLPEDRAELQGPGPQLGSLRRPPTRRDHGKSLPKVPAPPSTHHSSTPRPGACQGPLLRPARTDLFPPWSLAAQG